MKLRTTVRDGLERAGMLETAKSIRGLVNARARRSSADDVNLIVILSALLREDSNCVDVGAHKGSVLRHIVRLAPAGRHTAFEPLPDLAAALREQYPDVNVRQAAVSATAGTSSFVHVLNHPDYSGLKRRQLPPGSTSTTISVNVERLDDVLDPDQPVHFLKIDVEGGELGVLQGAERTLTQYRPVVALEHGMGGSDHYGTTPEQIFELLSGARLRVFDLAGGGPYDRDGLRRIYDSGAAWNFLAHA